MNFFPISSTSHLRDKFWVVVVLNNPCRFKKRVQLFHEFIERMQKYNVNLCVVEVAYGEQTFETENLYVPIKVQLKSECILWQKENMINIGISRLPSDWKYVAWIDADIDFIHSGWVDDTIYQLQHYSFIQLFSDSIDLGPDNEVMSISKSFGYCFVNKESGFLNNNNNYSYQTDTNTNTNTNTNNINHLLWHPGYAWAATREAIDTVGGLFEIGIAGPGDHHMAWSLLGESEKTLANDVSQDYKDQLIQWEKRASFLHKNVGYLKGTIYHYWHGKKQNRKYNERWDILINNNFQPSKDLYKDWQGLLVLNKGLDKLRDELRNYFHQRNEDSVDL